MKILKIIAGILCLEPARIGFELRKLDCEHRELMLRSSKLVTESELLSIAPHLTDSEKLERHNRLQTEHNSTRDQMAQVLKDYDALYQKYKELYL